MHNSQAIGVFDSGLGGLSVWQELVKILPNESIIYFADSAHCPYGEKSQNEVIELCQNIVDFLLEKSCKLIVIACNTATSAAINYLREHYSLPIIGVEPAIKPATLQTKTGKVGVIATQGTLKGEKFNETKTRYAQGVEVFIQIGYGLVELVENGKSNSSEAKKLLEKYLLPMLSHQVDQIVLGCTHYPFLIPVIEEIIKDQAQVINPAIAIARHTYKVLADNQLLNLADSSPKYDFYTTGNLKLLKKIMSQLSVNPPNLEFYKLNTFPVI
jgi:glutamate racemase